VGYPTRSPSIIGNRYDVRKLASQEAREILHPPTDQALESYEIRRIAQLRSQLSVEKAFWGRVSQPEIGCWLWMGPVDPSGDGIFSHPKYRGKSARRFALMQKLGRAISPQMTAKQTCTRSRCMRPDHLFEG
jgi:hypothetical protein